jgi:hypothetical protein
VVITTGKEQLIGKYHHLHSTTKVRLGKHVAVGKTFRLMIAIMKNHATLPNEEEKENANSVHFEGAERIGGGGLEMSRFHIVTGHLSRNFRRTEARLNLHGRVEGDRE